MLVRKSIYLLGIFGLASCGNTEVETDNSLTEAQPKVEVQAVVLNVSGLKADLPVGVSYLDTCMSNNANKINYKGNTIITFEKSNHYTSWDELLEKKYVYLDDKNKYKIEKAKTFENGVHYLEHRMKFDNGKEESLDRYIIGVMNEEGQLVSGSISFFKTGKEKEKEAFFEILKSINTTEAKTFCDKAGIYITLPNDDYEVVCANRQETISYNNEEDSYLEMRSTTIIPWYYEESFNKFASEESLILLDTFKLESGFYGVKYKSSEDGAVEFQGYKEVIKGEEGILFEGYDFTASPEEYEKLKIFFNSIH